MRLLIIPILFLATIVSFAQTPIVATTSDGKQVLLNQDGTWTWKPQDEDKPAEDLTREKAIKGVTPEKVALFFDDYNHKYMKFTVWLGELRELPNENGQVYGVEIKTQDNKLFSNFIFPNNLGFIMPTTLARLITEEKESSYASLDRMRGVNIYAWLDKSAVGHKLAIINCVEFLGRSVKNPTPVPIKAVGTCK